MHFRPAQGYNDYGFRLEATYSGSNRGSYHIEPVIQGFDDLHKLHFRPVQIDHAATDRQVERAQELLGDILCVRKVGKTYWRYGLTRVLIHMRGLDNMMLNIYDHPELLHELGYLPQKLHTVLGRMNIFGQHRYCSR